MGAGILARGVRPRWEPATGLREVEIPWPRYTIPSNSTELR